ncbi:conjugal transfer protein TraH [Photobacterium frigidiphilum]|uniref:Conjugal transfer protein TraH n=1 Tax=Photobacterium frigidiphilum TaxID=264736 RepID=A0A2T3J5Q2_9GAMM|nr:conjugal transfer protein TraH [Photobacterium frigidiphilum]PSU41457.1 conjugal transfer protein TraH [Photobacterium frigidiphilum]
MNKTLIATALLVATFSCRADVNGSLNSFFNGLGYSNVTNPSSFKGQTANYYTGGNLFVRTPVTNAQLVSITLPKISAGCGGIDMFLGGFSHINSTALTQLGKSIVANAVPFAVDLALQTWAPQLKQIRDNLQSIADKYLNQSINSCEAAQAGVSALAGFAGVGSQKYICATMGTQNNAFADWVAGQQECGAGGQADTQLNHAKNDPALKDMVRKSHNIVWSAILKNAFLASDTDLAQFLMSISGTYIYDTNGKPKYYSSLLTHNNNLINALLMGGKAKTYVCDIKAADKCLRPDGSKTITISTQKSLQNRIFLILSGMTNKLLADTPLSADEQSFLEYTTLPILTFIRDALEAGQPPNIAAYSTAISVQFVTIYLRNMLTIVKESLAGTNNDAKDIARIEDGIINANRFLDGLESKAMSAIIAEQQLIQQNRELRRQVEGQLSARARANLQFGS